MGSEGLSYAEKKALGFGTVKERLGKDSLGNFYDCCLTLQLAQDPVITPEGNLFSREAILHNLLQQKKAIKRNLAAWEAYQQGKQQKDLEAAAVEAEAKVIAFDRMNHMGASQKGATNLQLAIVEEAQALRSGGGARSVMNIKTNEERAKELKAFWMPSLTPNAEEAVQKPDTDTHCPATGKKLRLKDLIPVRWTKVPEAEAASASGHGMFMDPVTKDTLTNTHKLVVLAATGDVVLKETYEKCIKPDGHYNGVRIKEKEVIELQTGGTGFAGRDGSKVQTQKFCPLGLGNGRRDLRGQHQGARSMGGLVFMN